MEAKKVRGRFAPSPSGRMHLGNLCTALLAWLSVRSCEGEAVLRIEDLDVARCRPEYTDQLLSDLEWLGLYWDEGPERDGGCGPYEQSRRGELYKAAYEELRRQGLLYPCFCTRADLHTASAPHASDGTYLYSGRCASLTEEEIRHKSKERSPAWRVRVGETEISFTDRLQGFCRSKLAEDSGDFVLMRSDGIAAYQLAVTVDDALMGITEVVRGRDLLGSTARQIYLYRLLGFEPPEFCHTPLLTAPDGRRLSKREKDLDMGALRRRFTAEELLGRMAFLLNLTDRQDPLSAEEMVPLFTLTRIRKDNIVIDPVSFTE